jgi:hypothetical protein
MVVSGVEQVSPKRCLVREPYKTPNPSKHYFTLSKI